MSKVNYTFGVLSGGKTGIRHSDCAPSETQHKLLMPLWRKANDSGKLAELLIRFLRCSEQWPDYCHEHDSLNTYHIDVDLSDLDISFSDIVAWADECAHLSDKYKVSKNQTAVDRVTNRLFGVLTIK